MSTDTKVTSLKSKYNGSIAMKTVAGVVALFIIFAICTGIVGYRRFTIELVNQYATDAGSTADTARDIISGDDLSWIKKSGGTSGGYKVIVDRLERLCNSSGSTFIYVIVPDEDYNHITFYISTINKNSDYTRYDYGYYRETTNDEYKAKYKKLMDGESDFETVVRDKGYIETDKHITAMKPLKGFGGETKAILCVQRQLDALEGARNEYINKVFILFVILTIISVGVMSFFLHRSLIDPLKIVSDEAIRFAEEGTEAKDKLTDSIPNKDEIGLLAASIDQMETQICDYVDNITRITADRERIATELGLATRIQENMLPNIFPAFPDRNEFDVYAMMNPAKEIGGDFYDFFLIDDERIALVIADVSGKGIPAALFMMMSKIMIKTQALNGGGPAEILTLVNEQVCKNNREEMFVTVWLGILDLNTGLLTAANAGHEYPMIKHAGGNYEIYKDKHGFVIGGMEGMKYSEYEIQMEPGSNIFVYTDGLAEANSADGELFGMERALEILNQHTEDSPKEVIEAEKKAVEEFAGEAPQFDDLTMLCIEYQGKKG
jgi:sigma-B regulation protein RsbU (phosphoserine phosphatase)